MYSYKKVFSISAILLAIVYIVSGCAPQNSESVNIHSTRTEVPNPSPVLDKNRFVDALTNENYLVECKTKYPPVHNEQVDYRGILPGKTSVSDLPVIIGDPQKRTIITDDVEEWIYGNFDENLYYFVYTKNNLVDFISIENDFTLIQSLQSLLKTYGCPELIVATTKEPDYSNESVSTPIDPTYGAVYFEYITAGISFGFDGYPVSLSDFPVNVNFLAPEFLMSKYESVSNPYKLLLELNDAVH